jgi:hypothetical protein
MNRLHPATAGRCLILCFGALLAFGVLIVTEYPDLSYAINKVIGDRQAPGSSMGYFRDVYVLRGVAAFLLLSLGVLALAAKAAHRSLHVAFVGLFGLGIVMVVWSSLWYFRSIAAASGAVRP